MDNIRKALFQSFLDHTELDEDRIAVPNVNFEPPEDKNPWATLIFAPNTPSVATLGDKGADETDGFMRIELNVPQGCGTKEIEHQAEHIRSNYTAGRYFKYNKQCVMVTSCGFDGGAIVDNFFRIVCTVNWYAQIQRNLIT